VADPIAVQLTVTALVGAVLAAARVRAGRYDLHAASVWVLSAYTAAAYLALSWLVTLGFCAWGRP
jgi:hypothetical protein